MKKAYLLVVAVLLAAPAFAQGPFTDVPTDHWAYDAVDQLQKDGILIGYPDGTFAGKRNITRFEFAVAIARLMGVIPPPGEGVSKSELEKMLGDYAKKGDVPSIPQNLATKADVDAIRKLVDEFRDEIAALGVDVDALKRDVAALGARVDAVEAEQKRVRWTGDVNVVGVASGRSSTATVTDLDQRELSPALGRNVGVITDFDLKVVGRVSDNVTANATINFGNYLDYVKYVDDYEGGPRPTRADDGFFPYYLYVDAGLGGNASLTVGRFPLQFTPYTLKKIDVDSYTSILKTDDGNYPVDGAKLAINLLGIDWTWWAAKHDQNKLLLRGLAGQPNTVVGVFHEAGGNAVGGLSQVTQSAGVRLAVGLPLDAVLGATFYQAWDRNNWLLGAGWDQARVYGADLSVPIPGLSNLNFMGCYTRSDTLGSEDPNAKFNINDDNAAWDAKLGFSAGPADINVGYKDIGRNFAAAGAWDKIGRWTNPTNIKGPYADVAVAFGQDVKVSLNGQFLKAKQDIGTLIAEDDKVIKAEAAVRWGLAKNTCLNASYEWVTFDPDAAEEVDRKESYLTVGLGYQVSPNAQLSVGYQFIKQDEASVNAKGGVGVVQFGVSF